MKRSNRLCRMRVLVCVTLVFLLAVWGSVPAWAAEKGSLTLTYQDGQKALCFSSVALYDVAEMDDQGQYVLRGDFSAYLVDLNHMTCQSDWIKAALTLSNYAVADGITPLFNGSCDTRGNLEQRELDRGLYLVVTARENLHGYLYEVAPFLVSIPGIVGDKQWEYDQVLNPKFTRIVQAGGSASTPIKYSVVKHWVEYCEGQLRPSEVSVSIYKHGIIFQQVQLSDENDWFYGWTTIDQNAVWSIVERDVSHGYTVELEQRGNTWVLTNRLTPPTGEGEAGGTGDPPSDPPVGDLPGTGQVWWPLPGLVMGGMLCLLFGCWLRRRGREEET